MVVRPINYTKKRVLKDGTIFEEPINEFIVTAELEMEWVNNENPEEKIVVPWGFVGHQSDASQALGSGLTYASRYFQFPLPKDCRVR